MSVTITVFLFARVYFNLDCVFVLQRCVGVHIDHTHVCITIMYTCIFTHVLQYVAVCCGVVQYVANVCDIHLRTYPHIRPHVCEHNKFWRVLKSSVMWFDAGMCRPMVVFGGVTLALPSHGCRESEKDRGNGQQRLSLCLSNRVKRGVICIRRVSTGLDIFD